MRTILKTWLDADDDKKILMLRHGEIRTDTRERRFIGQLDLPLTETGRRQARYWHGCLRDIPLASIVSSDLSRCLESARIVAGDPAAKITALAELREIHLGGWDGMTFRQVQERWPDAFQRRGQALDAFRPPAGENFLDLRRRVIPAFERAVDQGGRVLLMVAHAGVNRVILCHILGMPLNRLFRIGQEYGAMNLIDRRADGYRIQSLNLPPAPAGDRSARRRH